jgi:DUF4097 and DUF4098 domain-containing protein YvlB
MKISNLFILLIIITSVLFASETKQLKKSFDIEQGKLIDIKTVSGMDVQVKSWDKNEVYFDLEVKVSCSNDEYEKKYVETFDIKKKERLAAVVLEFEEEDDDNGWSFWDIFKGKFGYSFSKEITGEIYIPKSNSLKADFRYSDIQLEDIAGELNLDGRSNDLYLTNCLNVFTVNNGYGKNFINNCGGKLSLDSRSSEISINEFDGPVRILADYSQIELRSVTGTLDLSTRSAMVKIENVGGAVEIKADYSDVTISKIDGFVNISNRSGSVNASGVEGIKIDAPYTKMWIDGVNGKSGKDIQLYNRSGKIQLQNIVGRVLIEDSYSDITLKNIEGHVLVETQSSKIKGENIKGNWKSESKHSSVRIKELYSDEIIIDNRSDVVDVRTMKLPTYVNIKNSYGSVDFSMPKGYSGGLYLAAAYGDVISDLPLTIRKEGSNTKAKVEMGSGNSKIYIETRSGNIEIKESL